MKKFFLSSLFLSAVLCAAEIKVAVAANVSDAIVEIKAAFEKSHPQTKVQVTLSSSGKLTAQIKHGAPYGAFLSANMKYPEALYKEKIAITKPLVYAEGALAYLTTKKLDLSKGMALLTSKDISKISIANPKTAPYGKAAFEAITNAGMMEAVKKKLVYAESVAQSVTYAISAADIGFVAKSSLFSKKMQVYQENVHYKDVDKELYTPIKQGIVLLKPAKESKEYREFYEFVLSDEAKVILKKYGYIVS